TAASCARSCTIRSIARWCARSTRSVTSPASRPSPSSARTPRLSRYCATSAWTLRRATASPSRSAFSRLAPAASSLRQRIGQWQRATGHAAAAEQLAAFIGLLRTARQRCDGQELAAPVRVLHRLHDAKATSIIESAGVAARQSQRRVAQEALHAALDAAAVVRARNDFLPGVAALGERDGVDAVQIEHLCHKLPGCDAVHLGQAGGDVERSPLLPGTRGCCRRRLE